MNTALQVEINRSDYSKIARIGITGAKHDVITVHAAKELGQWAGQLKWRPAEINWSAIGSVTPAVAQEFADALAKAVEIAKQFDDEAATITLTPVKKG